MRWFAYTNFLLAQAQAIVAKGDLLPDEMILQVTYLLLPLLSSDC